MTAAQRGWSIEETANKLMEVSAKAQERARLRDEGYALITAQNASAAAMRGRQTGRVKTYLRLVYGSQSVISNLDGEALVSRYSESESDQNYFNA